MHWKTSMLSDLKKKRKDQDYTQREDMKGFEEFISKSDLLDFLSQRSGAKSGLTILVKFSTRDYHITVLFWWVTQVKIEDRNPSACLTVGRTWMCIIMLSKTIR